MILTLGGITLRPPTVEDAPAFLSIIDIPSWAGMASPLCRTLPEAEQYLRDFLARENCIPFAVERDGMFVGLTAFYDLVPGLKVEIGNTIYSSSVRGTEVNPTAKYLLLEHAFESMHMRRVAMRVDHRNARSRAAILKLGGVFEGTLRSFRLATDGGLADVDYFSFLASEWPDVKANLQLRLGIAEPVTTMV